MLTRGFGIFAKGPLYIFYTTSGLLFVDPTCQVRGRIIKIESEGSDRTRDLQVTRPARTNHQLKVFFMLMYRPLAY
jgi:hypothetical protein